MFDWLELMHELNSRRISHDELDLEDIPAEMQKSKWLGYSGATEEEIQEAEVRLGITLPTSYRNFLKISNGWSYFKGYGGEFHLLPVSKIEWFANTYRDEGYEWWDYDEFDEESQKDEDYFVYGSEQDCIYFRPSYIRKSLQISGIMDVSVILLNPEVSLADGEWEAMILDCKLPGANRYKTFLEFMMNEPQSFYGYELA